VLFNDIEFLDFHLPLVHCPGVDLVQRREIERRDEI
jgi:hypothetical protein